MNSGLSQNSMQVHCNVWLLKLRSFNEKYNNHMPLPMYNEERIRYIIHYLLIADTYIKSGTFLDHLFISRTTLTQDFRYVRSILKHFHLKLYQKPNYGMCVQGEEQHLRLALVAYCVASFFVRRWLLFMGYKQGSKFVSSLSGQLKSLTHAASILGLMVVGALIASPCKNSYGIYTR